MARWVLACTMLVVTSTAVDASANAGELFDLCPPDRGMDLVVETLPEDAIKGGLADEQIRNAAESRLRAAGIYDPEADPYLYVNLNLGPPDRSGYFPYYSLGVEYKRPLLDLRLPLYRPATTWDIGRTGEGYGNPILSRLSQFLDKFLVEYLRVRDSGECQELRAKGYLTKERRTFDFSTLPKDTG